MIDRYQKLVEEGNQAEAEKILKWLLGEDQLLQSKSVNEYLSLYKEGEINFLPTYKYDQNSDKYDTSKKMRPPAW